MEQWPKQRGKNENWKYWTDILDDGWFSGKNIAHSAILKKGKY